MSNWVQIMINQQTANAVIPYVDRLEKASRSRYNAIRQVFNSELFSLTSLMGPMNDGPEWPSDAAWLALQHGNCACILSDGLSDPWVETNRPDTGLGLEVFIESPDFSLSSDDPMAIADTWMFPMTAEVSHTLASYPRLCQKLLDGEVLSTRFNIEHIKDGRGLVGALLHVPDAFSTGLATEMGKVELVAATLLTAEELRWLGGRGETGRRELLASLNEAGIGSRSLAARASVVGS